MSKMKRKPSVAKAGEKLSPRAASVMRKSWPTMFGPEGNCPLTTRDAVTVKPKSDAKNGQLFCADCGEAFQNNMQAWSHSGPASTSRNHDQPQR